MSVISFVFRTPLFVPVATFVAAFCSIIYELVLSQALTIIYGGTVLRYSVTIGLFLFSLGLGAFLYARVKRRMEAQMALFIVEALLSLFGFLGVFFVFLGRGALEGPLPYLVVLVLSHVPVVAIGILSGLEIPILTDCDEDGNFTKVLGIDYFGSLVGTLVYALFLYPMSGLVVTTISIVSLNLLLAVVCLVHYRLYSGHARARAMFVLVAILVLVWGHARSIESWTEKEYLTKVIQREYALYGVDLEHVEVKNHFTTAYQEVSLYDIYIRSTSARYVSSDTCLNLGEHIQMCNQWVDAYHKGLVHMPMALLPKDKKLSILILGGGDFIAVNYLRTFDARIGSIDLVDIDPQFQTFARTHPYLLEKNQGAFDYDKLTLSVGDAYSYVQHTDKHYDFILMDLPGLRHDKMLPLYSKEFYTFARRALAEGGILVSWRYPADMYPTHGDALEATLAAAGFKDTLEYVAWNKLPDKSVQPTDTFFVVGNQVSYLPDLTSDEYMTEFSDHFKSMAWRPLHRDDTLVSSIFKPNYDLLVSKPEVYTRI